jgi:uncharacterized membrane protein
MANELNVGSPSGATVYAIIRRVLDSLVWDGAASDFEAWDNASIDDYDVQLTDQGGDYYSADFPAAITAAGNYAVQYYLQAGGAPATSDFKLPADETIYWDGTAATDEPAAENYVSVERAKRYMNIGAAVSTYDDRISDLIPAACRMIDNYCDVEPNGFTLAEATEYYDGRGGRHLTLKRFPVTISAKVRLAQSALQVVNSSTANHQAYVSVDGGVMTLTRNASGVEATNTLTLSSYATISALATAITAVGSGWSASTPDSILSGYPASDIRNTQGYRDASNGETAYLEVYAPFLRGCYRTSTSTGVVWGYFPCGEQNIQATYTAGYSTIPDDLATAAAALTAALFRRSDHDTSLKSERIGDYSYTLGDVMEGARVEELSPDAATLLQKYRRVRAL